VTRLVRHLVEPSALARVAVPMPAAGFVIGRDNAQAPVAVPLFRAEPTRMAAVGGWWLGRLLAFRALGLGARVTVYTAWPAQWQGLGEAAAGQPDRVTVVTGGRAAPPPPSRMDEPGLVVWDVDQTVAPAAAPTTAGPPLGPWQAQLTVLPQLVAGATRAVEEAPVPVCGPLQATESTWSRTTVAVARPCQFIVTPATETPSGRYARTTASFFMSAQFGPTFISTSMPVSSSYAPVMMRGTFSAN